jgi:hypothetical protein
VCFFFLVLQGKHEITVSVDQDELGQVLCVEALDLADRVLWAGSYSEKFVSHVTQRAGGEKTFETFVKMLLKGLSGEQPRLVYLQLLTAEQIEEKRPRDSTGRGQQQHGNLIDPDKRVLVLTYRVRNT